ncbi:unnamed protein product [Prorocentrum cordatum]|uniref:Protein-serine/threonine kinase n=1 Tax=Prorocentrum cordatum TaxID=2364126 RepID=A0ABN9UWN5_9DINO|nr:unnamed protein product [Polarella glacialis]
MKCSIFLHRRVRAPGTQANFAVQFAFERISAHLKFLDPTVEKELTMVEVDEAERTALLTALQLTNDPRVQAIGRDVASAVRLSVAISSEKEFLMQQVESALLHQYGSIQSLRRDVVPNALLKLWGQNEPERLPSLAASKWQMTLEQPNVESMSISDELPQLIELSSVTDEDKAAVVEGAALVEGFLRGGSRSRGGELRIWDPSL